MRRVATKYALYVGLGMLLVLLFPVTGGGMAGFSIQAIITLILGAVFGWEARGEAEGKREHHGA